MTDTPSYNSFGNVFSSENDVWASLNFEEQQQQQIPRASYPLAPHVNQTDMYEYADYVGFPGQLQSEFNVPFPSHFQDAARNGLPRIDTKAALPRLSIVSDSSTSAGSMMPQTPYSWADASRLHVHAPLGTPLSPSNTQYPTFSPSVCLDEPITLIIDNRCVRSRKAYLLFPHQCHPIRPLPWVALTRGLFCRLTTTMRKTRLSQWNMS
ncbi:hypothetical protein C8R48DRAFT_160082 [Suillus tomentosus]|nr:hypothetical protein C8R48DRAFT_160082 [Suillus tomentosus]